MASIWFWIFTPIVVIIFSVVFSFLVFFIFAWLRDKLFIKRKIPKSKEKVSEFIKDNKELLANPGKSQINKKEEEEKNVKRRRAKYREFDKLRRLELKGTAGTKEPNDRTTPAEPKPSKPAQQPKGTGVLPSSSDRGNKESSRSSNGSKPKVKLDD